MKLCLEIVIVILKPLGSWRWHHEFQCLAIYKIQRTQSIDDIFSLAELCTKLSFTFNGIGHGMAVWDAESEIGVIRKAFGEPDYVYPSQTPSFGQYYYKKHDLHVVVHDSVVYYLERGTPDWVAGVKKEMEMDKDRNAAGKPGP